MRAAESPIPGKTLVSNLSLAPASDDAIFCPFLRLLGAPDGEGGGVAANLKGPSED